MGQGRDNSNAKETNLTKEVSDGLDASRQRLEAAGVSIAVFDDGSMRVLTSQPDTLAAIKDGGTVYSPKDMLMYVTLTERERRMLHSFKKQFGGTMEWETR